MQPYVRMLEQKSAHSLGFVGREIVRDDVNHAPRRLTGDDVAEKVDKRGARVPRHRLAERLARLGVQRGKERQRAVPVVLDAMAFGGIEAVEGLNRCFLITAKTARGPAD